MKIINLLNRKSLNKLKKYSKYKDQIINWNKEKIENIRNGLQDYKESNIGTKIIDVPRDALIRSQDWLEKRIRAKENDVLLNQGGLWAESITWSLIGGTAFGIAWLGFAKTEEIVIAQGKLEPINNVIEVQIPVGGVVEDILITEGELIEKDQLLIKLNSEISKSNLKSSEEILNTNKDIFKRLETLEKEGAISKIQLLQQKIKVAELENRYIENKVSYNYQNIKSPISGKVFDLKPTAKGFVGTRSEPVLKIVPVENLTAKVEISSNSIGFVKKGMPVDISIDSFPASDFGVIEGKIKSIGSDALPPDPSQSKGYRFPATIYLNSQGLKIKNGDTLPLQVGMSLTANIKLRKVSYLQLLLGTFQNKADSLKEI